MAERNDILSNQDILTKFQYARNIPLQDFKKWLEKPIYRIMPLEYLLQILEKKELFFPNIYKFWEDPYELFVFRQNYWYQGCEVDNSEIRLHHYGQCWSLCEDSDAMWRIYSQDKKSVRIKTSLGVFLQELFAHKDDMSVINFGIVEYKTEQQIQDWLIQNIKGDFRETAVIKSFFIKRDSFSHENELRFIISTPCRDGRQLLPAADSLTIRIEPSNIIQQITFDPRLSPAIFELFKKILLRYHIEESIISQSTLYKIDPLDIEI